MNSGSNILWILGKSRRFLGIVLETKENARHFIKTEQLFHFL